MFGDSHSIDIQFYHSNLLINMNCSIELYSLFFSFLFYQVFELIFYMIFVFIIFLVAHYFLHL